MKGYIEERVVKIASYIVENNSTVRQAAKMFGVSKSTVHKDISERLKLINTSMANEVRKVLDCRVGLRPPRNDNKGTAVSSLSLRRSAATAAISIYRHHCMEKTPVVK